jgi:uncharacterized protein
MKLFLIQSVNKILITILFINAFTEASAQGRKKVYFNKYWEETVIDSAIYYREAYYTEYNLPLGIFKDFYKSGKLQMTGTFSSWETRVGDFIWYYENGHKSQTGHYNFGLYELYFAWDMDGNKTANNGKGKLILYYEDGNIRSEGSFNQGVRSGDYIGYHRNGKKSEEGSYGGGKYTLFNSWDENGKGLVVEGNGESIDKFSNGQIKWNGFWEEGVRVGEWKWWHSNGQIRERVEYVNGMMEGDFIRWYASGKIYSKGKFSNGKKEGEWIWFREDGTALPSIYFEKGEFKNY